MTDTPPRLIADGLRKEFGTITALDRIDLSIDSPTILGVAGPNGSGITLSSP
jgi:ABC-2 type transport system ATP-binding protein